MNVIIARDVEKSYGKVQALKGITIKVPKGITAFVGENGAGKSTLIKILTGKLRADRGEFKILGTSNLMKIRENVGIIHERVSLPPEIPVEFFLEKVAKMYNISEKKVKETIKICGLEKVKNVEIGNLSFGFTKRVGIAQALIHEPKLIIADEPFSQLDATSKIIIKDLFYRLYKDRGISFFISSHNLYDLEQISNHFIIIHQGKIIREWSGVKVRNILLKAKSNQELMKYLKERGYDVDMDEFYVIVNSPDFKNLLRTIVDYPGEVYEIRSSSLESLFKEAVVR